MKIKRFFESNSDEGLTILEDLLSDISDIEGANVSVYKKRSSLDVQGVYNKLFWRKSHHFQHQDWARYYNLIREVLEDNMYEVIITGDVSFIDYIENFINRASRYGGFSEVGVRKSHNYYTIQFIKDKEEVTERIRDILSKGITNRH